MDAALECLDVAVEAIIFGNNDRGLKFIAIAKWLNPDVSEEDDVKEACEYYLCAKRSSPSSSSATNVNGNGGPNYTEEQVRLVGEIRRNMNHYGILGVGESCGVKKIRKVSLKVHPDKNKAAGSEEAFKKVSTAFKCLSDAGLRRRYDEGDMFRTAHAHMARPIPRQTPPRRHRAGGHQSDGMV